ncbi:MAG TPA: DUF4838 domain-containing protein [Chthoniobacteraceae bacterium]|nr:DUF4838 domain-containing protein [Chthoniobacteraceae bacterium]
MKRLLPTLLSCLLMKAALPAAPLEHPPLPPLPEEGSNLAIIASGAPHAVLIIPDRPTPVVKESAQTFSRLLARATGATLPVIAESQVKDAPEASVVQIHVGETQAARAEGLSVSNLPEESYRIVAREGRIFVLGRDRNKEVIHSVDSKPTRWALNQLLEQYLGVRWLWPGELGTYVPRSEAFIVPPMDVTYQPDLLLRRLRLIYPWMSGEFLEAHNAPALLEPKERTALLAEAVDWLENHQNGQRGNIRYGHAFGDWWTKYSEKHPDYFAVPPPGITQPKPSVKSVKLRLANPAVVEQIAQEYQEKGAPRFYNVCPNDGYGFDTSAETRAWDWPRDQDIHDIWAGKGNMTARHVRFWNRVHARLKQINPEVTLISYAYASYRTPPPAEVPLKARMILGIVDSYSSYDIWKAWEATGSRMILRPNWWISGKDAPYLPLDKMIDFMKFARRHQLIGMDKDSIAGYWATQGLNYYAMARLLARPDLTKDDILEEYTSAFGRAQPKIKAYFDYWQEITEEAGYPVHAGTVVSEKPDGIYERLVKEKGIPFNPRLGSFWILPYLYTDEMIGKGEAFLDEAAGLLTRPEDREALARVAFLRDGLLNLRTVRDLAQAAADLKDEPKTALKQATFNRKVADLYALRKRLTRSHVMWGELLYISEDKLRLPTRPENLEKDAPDLRGF